MRATLLVALFLMACSSCAAQQYPDNVPTMSDPAVVKLVITVEGETEGYCTAWKLDENRIMTAGHCCENEADAVYLTEGPHAIPGAVAKFLFRSEKHDVCVLKGKINGAPIQLAERDPALGEMVWTAGFPKVEYLISSGYWSGRDDADQCKASVAVWGGASGSPIMDKKGHAVGVLVAYLPPMSNLAYCTPLEWMKVAKAATDFSSLH